MKTPQPILPEESGSGLIVIIMVLSFLLTIGVVLITVTGTGPRVAGNVRHQQEAFNAAEAGFDAAVEQLNVLSMVDFSTLYRTKFNNQVGLDDPLSTNYFRKLTDEQLVQDVLNNPDNYIFASQAVPNDSRLSYTVFLIDDEAGGGVSNPMDALLICIGQGPGNTYVRLEILIEVEST